jgi:ABC-2 type transport system ATP-binding protein
MIELAEVTKRYGDRTAVHALDLAIPQGEVFAFLGPNGAGKTTTIKMMVGLLLPTAGTVTMAGFDIVKRPREAKSRLGYVPDQPDLYDKLTGREFLAFVGEMYGMSQHDAHAEIERLAELFGLTPFYNRLTESYSHGMKQRVAFASALLHHPAILLLDEPMVGLDPRTMRLVKDLLRAEAANGLTIFMSTHTLSIAEEVADRIGVIDQGELLFLGTVEELRQNLSATESNLEELFLQLTHDNRSATGGATNDVVGKSAQHQITS